MSLSKMAFDIHSMPPISTEAESLFSGAKLTVSNQKNKLRSEKIELLECVESWFQLGIFLEDLLLSMLWAKRGGPRPMVWTSPDGPRLPMYISFAGVMASTPDFAGVTRSKFGKGGDALTPVKGIALVWTGPGGALNYWHHQKKKKKTMTSGMEYCLR